MDTTHHKFFVPEISGLNVEYYFNEKPEKTPSRSFPPHMHNGIEFYVLIEGDASFMVESKLYTLAPGDVVLSRPNEIHHCILNSSSVHKHYCFWFNSTCEYLFSPFLSGELGEGNLISPSKENKARLFSLYEGLKAETDESLRRLYILLEILDVWSASLSRATRPQAIPPILRDILDDINQNFTSVTGLQYFTEKFYISQSTLNRLFKTYLHTTPKNYLDSKRLAHSRILLRQGKSVTEAGLLSGFSDCSNYIRLFKSRFRITPKQYKEQT